LVFANTVGSRSDDDGSHNVTQPDSRLLDGVISLTTDSTLTRPATAILREVISSLRATDIAAMHPTQVHEMTTQLALARNLIDALDTQTIALAKTSGEWAADGARSLNDWIRTTTRCSRRTATIRVAATRLRAHAPTITANLDNGTACLESVATITHLIDDRPHRLEALPQFEVHLANVAANAYPEDVKNLTKNWLHHIDETAVTQEHVDRTETAHLNVSTTINGMVAIDGILDPETGALLQATLGATRDHITRTNHPDAPRTPLSQRNVEALKLILQDALLSPHAPLMPGGLPVTINVTMTIESLRAELGHGTNPAHLDHIGPIPAATARRLACDANIIPIILGTRSEILDQGRKKRLFTQAQRKAIINRDQHCRWPDCHQRIQDCHHIINWAHGGKTDLNNAVGLCLAHHHAVHERGYTMTGNPNDRIDIQPPQHSRTRTPIHGTTPPVRNRN
jgi:hypothetical protein